ncbi:MAG: PrsW family glutamic-type intramembrane protease [bacterium]|nr:PrsW family glutamic-type intramembrane protease [bacterium]
MAAAVFIKIFPFVLITLGLLPSAIWLLFYLRQDLHPEPKKMILKVFLWGMLVAPLAVLAQYVTLAALDVNHIAAAAGIGLIALAGIEELLKYLVVRTEIEEEPDFNEPTDAMVYMIAAALGFATIENISIAFSIAPEGVSPGQGINTANLLEASRVLGVRFLGATLLHAFSSAVVGYFLAVHFFKKRGLWTIWMGLGIATTLHALFNYLILQSVTLNGLVFLVSSVCMVGVIVGLFKHVRSMASRSTNLANMRTASQDTPL